MNEHVNSNSEVVMNGSLLLLAGAAYLAAGLWLVESTFKRPSAAARLRLLPASHGAVVTLALMLVWPVPVAYGVVRGLAEGNSR